MSTQFDSYPYHHRSSISPPVSPKTLPHGYKRKASTQDDEVEHHTQISNSFKKLRLSKLADVLSESTAELRIALEDARRATRTDADPTEYVYRELESHAQPIIQPSPNFEQDFPAYNQDADDYMGVDDTSDRVWIHDLDAEIKQIEAEEAQNRDGVRIIDGGTEYSKVPEHILRHNPKVEDSASNLQMVLYRDPISISVPQEEDAVRKAILEARRRLREKQHEQLSGASHTVSHPEPVYSAPNYMHASANDMGDDGMDID